MLAPRASFPLLARSGRVLTPHIKRPGAPRYVHSALLDLSGLSSSRESQHFSKERRVPRIEYSSQLQLIRSSEVDPFDAPGSSPLAPGRNAQTVAGATVATPELSLVAFQSVLKELDMKKQEVNILNTALDRLTARYNARGRDARNLSWIVLALALGFVFPGWLREPLDRFSAWIGGHHPSNSVSVPQTTPVALPITTSRAIGAESEPRDSLLVHSKPLTSLGSVPNSNPNIWSRFFWASPP